MLDHVPYWANYLIAHLTPKELGDVITAHGHNRCGIHPYDVYRMMTNQV